MVVCIARPTYIRERERACICVCVCACNRNVPQVTSVSALHDSFHPSSFHASRRIWHACPSTCNEAVHSSGKACRRARSTEDWISALALTSAHEPQMFATPSLTAQLTTQREKQWEQTIKPQPNTGRLFTASSFCEPLRLKPITNS